MFQLLRRNLLDVPQVGRVVRPEELVAGTFTPSVERPFVRTHEIFARHHGMHLVPDDGLREVQTVGRQARADNSRMLEKPPQM